MNAITGKLGTLGWGRQGVKKEKAPSMKEAGAGIGDMPETGVWAKFGYGSYRVSTPSAQSFPRDPRW